MKYRIYPTKSQATRLNETLEYCRRVYNSMLCNRRQSYERDGIDLTYHDQAIQLPDWKAEHPELTTVFSQVLQNVARRVDLAFESFFRRVAEGEKSGYPRYKSAGCYDSITYPQWGNGCTITDAGRLHLSKIGDVRIRLHRPIQGTPKTCTIRRYGDKWYACLSCEVEIEALPSSDEAVGIDVGLKTFAALSNGESIPNPRFYRREEKALAKAQRRMAKHPKGSASRKKARKVVGRVHERIGNKRHHFVHQESRQIVDRFDVICMEDLAVANLSRRPKPKADEETGEYLPNGASAKSGMNKSIADAGWTQFRSAIVYKAERAGRTVVFVNPAHTSSDCSECGERVPKTLKERVHRCPSCGLVMDRDTNAARNILAVGLHSLTADGADLRLVAA